MEGPPLVLLLAKLATWVFYPFSLAGLLLVFALCRRGVRTSVRAAIALALALLWGGGSRLASEPLVRSLESYARPPAPGVTADAIVVLGGGLQAAIPPRRAVEVTDAGDRVLEGARLWREGRAPRIVTSGGSFEGTPPQAASAAELLRFLGVPPDAILEQSAPLTTREEALAIRRVLEPLGAERILLVTSALHMRRAAALFRGEGFDVVPAPTDFLVIDAPRRSLARTLLTFLPRVESLSLTTRALHEWLGLAVARASGWAA